MSSLSLKVKQSQDYINKLIAFISSDQPGYLNSDFFNRFERIFYPQRSAVEEASHQALFEFVKNFLEQMEPRPLSLMDCQRYRRITQLSSSEIVEKLNKEIKDVIFFPEQKFLENLEEEFNDGIKQAADEVSFDLAEMLLDDLLKETVSELNRLEAAKNREQIEKPNPSL